VQGALQWSLFSLVASQPPHLEHIMAPNEHIVVVLKLVAEGLPLLGTVK
jgi:hypothetical protein